MTFFAAFAPSVAALNGHSVALQSVGTNIANVTSTGYKEVETRFTEQLSNLGEGTFPQFGGMRPQNQVFVRQQGQIVGTGRALDVAISGQGFLVTNPQQNGSGELQLTRAGSLDIRNVAVGTADHAFLVDQSGNFVFGWPSDGLGGFQVSNNLASLQPIRVDPGAAAIDAVATSSASVAANLNAAAEPGTRFDSSLPVFDSTGAGHTLTFEWTRDPAANSWTLAASVTGGTVTGGTPATMTFDATGALIGPATRTFDLTYGTPGAAAASIDVDFSGMSQFAGASATLAVDANGSPPGTLRSIEILNGGIVQGNFTNGQSLALGKLALATVPNPDGLGQRSGTHFVLSERSGGLTLHEADRTALGNIQGGALEQSTVDLAEQFTTMIVTQRAYTSSAQALRVVNEMTQVATSMKI